MVYRVIWGKVFGNGMLDINIPRSTYKRLVRDGVVLPNFYQNDAVHVPASGLDAFNAAIREGPPNIYHLEVP